MNKVKQSWEELPTVRHAETLKRRDEFLRQHEAMLQCHEEMIASINRQLLERAATMLARLPNLEHCEDGER